MIRVWFRPCSLGRFAAPAPSAAPRPRRPRPVRAASSSRPARRPFPRLRLVCAFGAASACASAFGRLRCRGPSAARSAPWAFVWALARSLRGRASSWVVARPPSLSSSARVGPSAPALLGRRLSSAAPGSSVARVVAPLARRFFPLGPLGGRAAARLVPLVPSI